MIVKTRMNPLSARTVLNVRYIKTLHRYWHLQHFSNLSSIWGSEYVLVTYHCIS